MLYKSYKSRYAFCISRCPINGIFAILRWMAFGVTYAHDCIQRHHAGPRYSDIRTIMN